MSRTKKKYSNGQKRTSAGDSARKNKPHRYAEGSKDRQESVNESFRVLKGMYGLPVKR